MMIDIEIQISISERSSDIREIIWYQRDHLISEISSDIREIIWIGNQLVITMIIILDLQKVCWDVSSSDAQAPILLYNCHGQGGNQAWRWLLWWWSWWSWMAMMWRRRVIRPGGNYRTMTICNDLNSISRYDVDNQWLVHGGNPRLV